MMKGISQHITADKVNLMLREARGMFLFPEPENRLARMGLVLIEPRHGEGMTLRVAVPFDARNGATTGISAADRAWSILRAIHPDVAPGTFASGYILPLVARTSGLHDCRGHTEGAVELARYGRSVSGGCHVRSNQPRRRDGQRRRVEGLRLPSWLQNY